MMHAEQRNQLALQLFQAGVDAVGGYQATHRAVAAMTFNKPVHVVAIGKASDAMARGASEALGENLAAALVISKHDHIGEQLLSDSRFECIEAGHPVPDEHSLEAGKRLYDFVSALEPTEHLLFLVSGGASSLVEHLNDDMTLEKLQAHTNALLASGADIGEMNRSRRKLSKIKGGKLASRVRCQVDQLLISDVEGDVLSDIGSGLLVPNDSTGMHEALPIWNQIQSRIIASSDIAQAAVGTAAIQRSLALKQHSGSLFGDVEQVLLSISQTLEQAESGVYVWGGEPTVKLPESPGRGGRNQHLALALSAVAKKRRSVSILVCGTDGSDGPTADAGGVVNEHSYELAQQHSIDIETCLQRFDAGNALSKIDALVTTGPTGTNVMDLCVAIVD